MKFSTLITEPKDYSAQAIAVYKSLGPVCFWPELGPGDRDAVLAKTNILVVRLANQINRPWLDRMPNLKVIATSTTGLNHIDTREAEKRGIKILSLRGHTSFLNKITSTAEETLGLMLALVRRLPWAFDDVKKGHWNRYDWRGHQLFGMTLGILGLGRLGKMVARYGKALGMNVLAADPHVSAAAMKQLGVKKVTMEALFRASDILSLHVLLTNRVIDLVKERHLKMMKPASYLINTARGELVEKGALEKALKEKWIAGAAVDVMRDEEGSGAHLVRNPLFEYAKKNKNLIIVPHIGGATFEAMQITEEFLAGLVKKALAK